VIANETHEQIEALPGLKELWMETLGDARVRIAILDGPADLGHPSFAGAKLKVIETQPSILSDTGLACEHGTHITSVIFGQHGGPVRGISPNCSGVILPIFRDGRGDSISACTHLDLARAIQRSVEEGAHIINISGGEFSFSGTAHPTLVNAIRHASAKGALILAATGNEGCECHHIPGALPGVLPVGAMSWDGSPLGFSNWGEKYRKTGILAPGENITGAAPPRGITSKTGTSYAVPIVSGIAALLLSLQFKRGKKPDTKSVHACLLDGAEGCDVWPVADCNKLLRGRLNISRSIRLLKSGRAQIMTSHDNDQVSQSPLSSETGDGETYSSIKSDAKEGNALAARNSLNNPENYIQGRSVRGFDKLGGVVPCGGCGGSPCSCGTKNPAQLAFAIGQLGIDFGTETRFNYFAQTMGESPTNLTELIRHLEKSPWDAASVHWILYIDSSPIYAIQPQGPFAGEIYRRLREFLEEQLTKSVGRVSIPGIVINGTIQLMSGQSVQIIIPEIRGMYNWTTNALVEAVCGKPSAPKKGDEEDNYAQKAESVKNFLERVYHELRNLGVSSEDRALNYSVTNALNVAKIFEARLKDQMQLDTVQVVESSIRKQGVERRDVLLTFFDPRRRQDRARKIDRFAVDVSDIVPVMVGGVSSWDVH
jgi:cyanobactin maturation PatA/PatG family protease